MNAPELPKAPALVIGLVGPEKSGRRTAATFLKRRHGFAVNSLGAPLREALQYLYGVSPTEILFDESSNIERLGASPRQLIDALYAHAKTNVGEDLLLRRLVERCVARGDWGRDLVITDVSEPAQIRWIRQNAGGQIWWMRRDPPACPVSAIDDFERLMLDHFDHDDVIVVNDLFVEDLEQLVAIAVSRARAIAVQKVAP